MKVDARQDRRHTRRQETIAQVVQTAVQVMTEQGAAGLTLGEVARRMDMQTPSLYGYFDSKHALYDAIFAQGWRELHAVFQARFDGREEADDDLYGYLLDLASTFVRWSVEHPSHAQLMAWRPIPGYEPSPEAYGPAVAVLEDGHAMFARLQARGRLRGDVPVDRLLKAWTVLTSGVISQQLANAPREDFQSGTFTSLLPDIVEMYLEQYATSPEQPS